jgi:hypothetical protein
VTAPDIRHHPERCLSLFEIARLFGRDHTTIKAGIDVHARPLGAVLPEPHP